MLRDKDLFITQNGEALASRKGRWRLCPLHLSPAPPSRALGAPPSPSGWGGGGTAWTLLLRLEGEHHLNEVAIKAISPPTSVGALIQ